MISVIIIVKNEQDKIHQCLDAVAWADEIVIVDSGSTDATVQICREYTDIVNLSEWSGFGMQKNKALALATKPWILSIDADEIVDEKLQQEILELIHSNPTYEAYEIPRRSNYCGRWMNHCGWSPDYVLRLFKRGSARFSDDSVHEKVLVTAPIGRLINPILHSPFINYEQVLNKINSYSTLSARDKAARGETSSLFKAILRGQWAFIRTYLIQLGFLDGKQGFALSLSNAQGTYYKYLKLSLLNEAKTKTNLKHING